MTSRGSATTGIRPRRSRSLILRSPRTASCWWSRIPRRRRPVLPSYLATVASFGENGWHDYWSNLRKNDVRVVDGWEQAYETDFTAGGGSGDQPLVVSCATDPAADVVFSDG